MRALSGVVFFWGCDTRGVRGGKRKAVLSYLHLYSFHMLIPLTPVALGTAMNHGFSDDLEGLLWAIWELLLTKFSFVTRK